MSDDPERLCIVSGEHLPASDLIRFVVSPSGEVTPDLQLELPGRGVWVAARHGAVSRAVTERRFPKAFRQDCTAPPDLADRIRSLIRAKARQYLALANKARLVVSGYEKTGAALAEARVRVLVEASDGAEDGRRKLRVQCLGECEIVTVLDSHELSLALGRANVIHAALAGGSLAEKFLAAARRIEAFEA